MKGMLFALLDAYVIARWDEPALDAALAKSEFITQEPFVGPGTYPDADFHELVTRCAEQVGVSRSDFLRGLGEYTFPEFLRFFPQAAEGHDHPLPFLQGIPSVVHPEIERLFSRSRTPTLTFEETTREECVVEYHSSRQLCQFMEGLLDGVAAHFQVPIEQHHERCMLRGDAACQFHLYFGRPAPRAA